MRQTDVSSFLNHTVLDINLLREEKGGNPELVRQSQKKRYADVGLVDQVIAVDVEWRQQQFKVDNLRADFGKVCCAP
jgi:seryl-tRNA synthetase